ncbi:GntR family transcriptional regulator, transcriptional repressor for pyruvate dehydrogenase complex [Micromonospora phaseoli]|uniref:GntR family transcriptional regulator, transcriptional repressor for pyruvate dehydrogenase complex n=1 Tax=Micromonospora phaseoli TaxID=1144548 RepID=A0A1H6UUZ3_9ACTN|nr:GntR family transcriptional repressor for pyruvate dehydrogenase complex [Micromonospora phaseoli]GIJ80717.1 GntR family transcriptional regulator [Micromonospora phaseoli]SEI96078.1 GntR family transcriptional regulator, transcriptional repressor for pyruvate dehydrogenase complex [Micromonospora phaseoli]
MAVRFEGGLVALTDDAIARIRSMIQSGELPPGARLPPEPQLAAQMGLSRSGVREAVKVLESARVLDVRRGDGTYVTSLAPRLLLEGLGVAVELLRDDTLLEVMEVRRMLEPVATGLAALRMTETELDDLAQILEDMRAAADDAEKLIQFDTAFHHTVIATTGNETLTSLLDGLSSRTVRARVWRGLIEGNAAHKTIDEHHAIYLALRSRDQLLAHASALMHVNTSEAWLRTVLAAQPTEG